MARPEDEAEIVARIAYSTMYRTLGIGTESFAFGRRLLALTRLDQSAGDRISAVAHRLVFVEYLVEEVSRLVGAQGHDPEDALRLHENIDSLEVFLLCTCIDTLAAGGRWEDYPTWLRSHRESISTILSGHQVALSLDDYILATDALHLQYTSQSGLTRGFADFFRCLPASTKEFISDSMLMIHGPPWNPQFEARMHEWQSSSTDDKLNQLARGYFYEIRSQYAHASRVHPVTSPSAFNRHEEAWAGAESMERQGWNLLFVYNDEHSEDVSLTLLVRSTTRESDLLRLALSSYVLTKLGFRVDSTFPRLLVGTIRARNAVQGAIVEIEKNEGICQQLHSYTHPISLGEFNASYVPVLSTAATRRLVSAYADFVDLFLTDLSGYVREVDILNDALLRLRPGNRSASESTAQIAWDHLLDDPQVSHSYLILEHTHKNLPYNLRYHLERGQVNYRHGRITDAGNSGD